MQGLALASQAHKGQGVKTHAEHGCCKEEKKSGKETSRQMSPDRKARQGLQRIGCAPPNAKTSPKAGS